MLGVKKLSKIMLVTCSHELKNLVEAGPDFVGVNSDLEMRVDTRGSVQVPFQFMPYVS